MMLPRLQAERQLLAIEAASVAHGGRDYHASVMRRLNDQLNDGERPAAQRPKSLDQLAAIGIQVVKETKES